MWDKMETPTIVYDLDTSGGLMEVRLGLLGGLVSGRFIPCSGALVCFVLRLCGRTGRAVKQLPASSAFVMEATSEPGVLQRGRAAAGADGTAPGLM